MKNRLFVTNVESLLKICGAMSTQVLESNILKMLIAFCYLDQERGYVIFVPEGSGIDPSTKPVIYEKHSTILKVLD